MLEPAVRQKFARVRENYNELRLTMEGNYAVVFRAYNEGVGLSPGNFPAANRSESLQRGIKLQLPRRLPRFTILWKKASFRTTNGITCP